MREIKFRAWSDDGENKGMLPVEEIIFESDKVFVKCPIGSAKVVSRVIERDTHKTILMQFTGLLDKDGVEIYEGDIIQYGESKGLSEIVEWKDNMWTEEGFMTGFGEFDFTPDQYKIIGNIHKSSPEC